MGAFGITVESGTLMSSYCCVWVSVSLWVAKYDNESMVFPVGFSGWTIHIFVQQRETNRNIFSSTLGCHWIEIDSLDNSINQEWLSYFKTFSIRKLRYADAKIICKQTEVNLALSRGSDFSIFLAKNATSKLCVVIRACAIVRAHAMIRVRAALVLWSNIL